MANKIDSIINFSIILNRGYVNDSDCDFFDKVNHPELIKMFINYVEENKEFIGMTRIENRQSIADSGCDVFIELRGNVKIGVQIKSKNDVLGGDFANKVKAQYAESSALGLDKFYILICSPINSTSEKKINYVVSHFATYKTNYHAIFNPNNCLRIFQPGGLIPIFEFNALKQLYSREESESHLESVLKTIKESLGSPHSPKSNFNVSIDNAIKRSPFQKLSSANKFLEFLSLSDDISEESVLEAINSFIQKVGKLSQDFRSLYYLIISESTKANNFVDALEMDLYELESLLNTDASNLLPRIKVLSSSKYDLIRQDEDEPNIVTIFIWIPGDFNLVNELRLFCEEENKSLEDMLINGDFSILN